MQSRFISPEIRNAPADIDNKIENNTARTRQVLINHLYVEMYAAK